MFVAGGGYGASVGLARRGPLQRVTETPRTRAGAREFGEERLGGRLGSVRLPLVGGCVLAVCCLLVIGFCLRRLL